MKRASVIISQIAVFTALSVVGRLVMVMLPNISPVAPLTFIAGYLNGGYVGFIVGVLSMVISDIFIGIGPWTIFTAFFMGIVGLSGGLLKDKIQGGFSLFLFSYLTVLVYDLGTSISTLVLFGVPIEIAIINLFIPVFILGIPYPMGPIHELSSSILVVGILNILNRFDLKGVMRFGE